MMGQIRLWLGAATLRLEELGKREEGQGLVEYALILALISVLAIGALTAIGVNVVARLEDVAGALTP